MGDLNETDSRKRFQFEREAEQEASVLYGKKESLFAVSFMTIIKVSFLVTCYEILRTGSSHSINNFAINSVIIACVIFNASVAYLRNRDRQNFVEHLILLKEKRPSRWRRPLIGPKS